QSSPHHRANAGQPAVRCENARRRLLSVAGGIRQKALPDAWRRGRFRRAEAEPKRQKAWPVHQTRDGRTETDLCIATAVAKAPEWHEVIEGPTPHGSRHPCGKA